MHSSALYLGPLQESHFTKKDGRDPFTLFEQCLKAFKGKVQSYHMTNVSLKLHILEEYSLQLYALSLASQVLRIGSLKVFEAMSKPIHPKTGILV